MSFRAKLIWVGERCGEAFLVFIKKRLGEFVAFAKMCPGCCVGMFYAKAPQRFIF